MTFQQKNNYAKYVLSNISYKIGTLFCIGAIIQAFMIKIGLTEEQVYFYNTLMQGIQVVVMFVMLFISDRIKKVKAVAAMTSLSFVMFLLMLIIGALLPSINNVYTILFFAISSVCYVGYGIHNILSYVLPYNVLDMEDYGEVTGGIGGIGGIFTFLISILHSFIISRFDYSSSMIIFLLVAIIGLFAAALGCLSMQEMPSKTNDAPKKDFVKVLRNKSTYILLIPNFIRGITTGIVGVITVIAISRGIITTQSSAFLNVVTQLAILVGSLLFAFTCKKFKVRKLLFISTLFVVLLLPLTVIKKDAILFLVLYGIMYLFMIIIDTSIPVLITEIIPEDEIGGYTSIRMMVFTAGTSVATLLITPITNLVGYVGLLIFASICLLICCLTYYFVATIYKKGSNRNTKEKNIKENIVQVKNG